MQNTWSFPELCGWMSTNFPLFLIVFHLRGFQSALYILEQVRSTAFHFLFIQKRVFSGVSKVKTGLFFFILFTTEGRTKFIAIQEVRVCLCQMTVSCKERTVWVNDRATIVKKLCYT